MKSETRRDWDKPGSDLFGDHVDDVAVLHHELSRSLSWFEQLTFVDESGSLVVKVSLVAVSKH